MLKAGAFTFALALLGTACGVGDDGGPTVDNKGMNGLQCTTTYATKGSVMNVPAIPDNDGDGQPDILGCWPSGTWSFTATPTGAGDGVVPECSPAPQIEPMYQVSIAYGCYPAGKSCAIDAPPENAGEYGFDVELVTQLTLRNHLKYSSVASGCEGIFEFYSDDGKSLWNFHPMLNNADSSLVGQGEFQRYDANQYAP